MGANGSRYQGPRRAPQPAVYWRRRFLALVAGFGVLSLVAWAFSGALAVGRSGALAAGSAGSPHAAHGTGGSPGGAGPAGSAAGSSAAGASAGGSGGTAGRASAGGGTGSARSAGQGGGQAARERACQLADIVLSLSTSKDSYRPGQRPVFDVQVVSTASQPCRLDLGRRHLALVVRSGKTRIWSSADCPAAPRSDMTRLVRGVPATVPISWHRKTSVPGCAKRGRQVAGGTYRATAADGGLASPEEAFRIS
ncbi:MAG TPA: hypothetical protein VH637_17370 [Streptosporangiaceae bacterium]|jgi:hypothetical protein